MTKREYIIEKLVDGETTGITRAVKATNVERAIEIAVSWWRYGYMGSKVVTGRHWDYKNF